MKKYLITPQEVERHVWPTACDLCAEPPSHCRCDRDDMPTQLPVSPQRLRDEYKYSENDPVLLLAAARVLEDLEQLVNSLMARLRDLEQQLLENNRGKA